MAWNTEIKPVSSGKHYFNMFICSSSFECQQPYFELYRDVTWWSFLKNGTEYPHEGCTVGKNIIATIQMQKYAKF